MEKHGNSLDDAIFYIIVNIAPESVTATHKTAINNDHHDIWY